MSDIEEKRRTDPKRHHAIPEMLSGRFCDEKGVLHCYDKQTKRTWSTSPKNVFVHGHLYSLVRSDGSKDPSYENEHFYPLDSDGSALIEKIVTSVRAGRSPQLSDHEKSRWDEFYFYQWKRLPDIHRQLRLVEDGDSVVDATVAQFEREHRPLSDSEKSDLANPEYRDRLKRNAVVESLVRPGPLVASMMASKGLAIARPSKANKTFIIGSQPFVRAGPAATSDLRHPEVELWLPIAQDVAITPFGTPGQVRTVNLPDQMVRTMNEQIRNNSRTIAGSSKRLIESLAR